MSILSLLLELLSFGAIFSSILVITSNNPVVAVIFLILLFINTAGYLILMGIGFIGLSYIIIYIGAITVLILFIIMMINIRLVDLLEIGKEYTKNFPLAILIGTIFIYEIYTILPFSFNNVSNTLLDLLVKFNGFILNYEISINDWVNTAFNPVIADTALTPFLQIEAIGQGLYTYGASWLIITSIILLLAMVAPIFISKTKKTIT